MLATPAAGSPGRASVRRRCTRTQPSRTPGSTTRRPSAARTETRRRSCRSRKRSSARRSPTTTTSPTRRRTTSAGSSPRRSATSRSRAAAARSSACRATAQIPHYAKAGDGRINSFAFVGGPPQPTSPPDNGQQPVPGIGVPPATPPAGGDSRPRRRTRASVASHDADHDDDHDGAAARDARRGRPRRPPSTTATTPPPTTTHDDDAKPRRPPKTTTTATTPPRSRPVTTTTARPPVTTTTTTTTTATNTTGGASCGTTGLRSRATIRPVASRRSNMAPGGSASEVMTVRNDTNQAFTVSLQATGTQNSFWNDLQMGVWEDGTAAPSPLPPLLQWTSQANNLGSGTLQPGQTIKYKIELYLPTTAGNADQNKSAVIDLDLASRRVIATFRRVTLPPRYVPRKGGGCLRQTGRSTGFQHHCFAAALLQRRRIVSFCGSPAKGTFAALPVPPCGPRPGGRVRGGVDRPARSRATGSSAPAPSIPVLVTTTTAVVPDLSSPQPGQQVTLTATVTALSGTGSPSARSTSQTAERPLGSASLSPSGTSAAGQPQATAKLTKTFGSGTHISPRRTAAPTTRPPPPSHLQRELPGNVSLTVTSAPTPDATAISTLAATPGTVLTGQSVTLTASVVDTDHGNAPVTSGAVQFYDNGSVIGSSATVDGTTGIATLTWTGFAPGSHPITAKYSRSPGHLRHLAVVVARHCHGERPRGDAVDDGDAHRATLDGDDGWIDSVHRNGPRPPARLPRAATSSSTTTAFPSATRSGSTARASPP